MEQQAAATHEIARNVTETATAAHQVADSIAEVSRDAVAVGTQASDMREGSAGVAASIETLRQTVVRVVRTATVDADRRKHARVTVDESCTVQTQSGARLSARIRDVSRGGAWIVGIDGNADGRGTLTLDRAGGDMRAEFDVRWREKNGDVHVAFVDGQVSPGFLRFVESAVARVEKAAA